MGSSSFSAELSHISTLKTLSSELQVCMYEYDACNFYTITQCVYTHTQPEQPGSDRVSQSCPYSNSSPPQLQKENESEQDGELCSEEDDGGGRAPYEGRTLTQEPETEAEESRHERKGVGQRAAGVVQKVKL